MGAPVEIPDLSSADGLKELDSYLQSKAFISGEQASKDDAVVYSALPEAPASDLANLSRWYNGVSDLLSKCFPGTPAGVIVRSHPSCKSTARELSNGEEAAAPSSEPQGGAEAEDDDDLDLFGEETEEEKKAAAEREEKLKASGKKKESGKSSVLLDVKPWDDETDMVKLEEAVRSVSMPGLHWGASKLAPVGFGIKKLQIMMTIEDDLVSVDNLIEDYLTEEPRNEFIQSCDIAAFNKI